MRRQALTSDPTFLPHVEEYAKSEEAFRAAFKSAFEKLISLGCPAKCQVKEPYPVAADKRPALADKFVTADRCLRDYCMHGSLERAQLALQQGADPSAREVDSQRGALHKAAFWGHCPQPPHMRLPHPVHIQRSVHHSSSHCIACATGHDHIIPWLLSLKCDPNVADCYGDTPLHDAARFGHNNCVGQLVQGGASVHARNSKGQTPADVAVAYGKVVPSVLGAAGTPYKELVSKGLSLALGGAMCGLLGATLALSLAQ